MADWIIDRTINLDSRTADGVLKTPEVLKLLLENPRKAEKEMEKALYKRGVLNKENDPNNPLTRRWFTYLRSYGLMNVNDVTEIGRLFAESKLSLQEVAFLQLINRVEKITSSSTDLYLLKIVFLLLKRLVAHSKNDAYITREEFSELISPLNSDDDASLDALTADILGKRAAGTTIPYAPKINDDIWFNSLNLTGIFEQLNRSLYVKDFDLFETVVEFYETGKSSTKPYGDFESEFVKHIPFPTKGSSVQDLTNLKKNKHSSKILVDFFFGDFDLRKIKEKYFAVNKTRDLVDDALKTANLDPSSIGMYRAFKNHKNIIVNKLLRSTDNELVEVAKIMEQELIYNEEVNSTVTTSSTKQTGGCNKIYYGAPGCGKSFIVKKALDDKGVAKENRIRVTFHPEYTNTDFVGQILPTIEEQDDASTGGVKEVVKYIFNPGPFTLALKRAAETSDMVYLIIEEINRGNAAAIFGDLFQLLDRKGSDDRNYGESQYHICNPNVQKFLKLGDGDELFIPSNLTILATMNSSDQNVFTLDTAFKRRWSFEQVSNDIKSDKGHAYKDYKVPGTDVTWETFLTKLNDEILENKIQNQTNEDKRLGKYFVDKECLTDKKEDIANVQEKAKEFAYKVLEYVWNDVCKIGKEEWFDVSKYKTLEQLIEGFVHPETGDSPLDVFKNITF